MYRFDVQHMHCTVLGKMEMGILFSDGYMCVLVVVGI